MFQICFNFLDMKDLLAPQKRPFRERFAYRSEPGTNPARGPFLHVLHLPSCLSHSVIKHKIAKKIIMA
jgi:hypothetical protein